ncbi:hypothetical protein EGR_02272 [Echinococcus granulosus]|uniref:Uncharacterized protein n=1 Tax=Echinococcus granulosus TaxID=6210 RepID=W6UPX4_ECHGR|nr:hypothetical protein EGR_02272 [Echinococcus granulosus]EUB62831.1 hypothetical protein EGR_02272 [Echinococcus granulosus]
MSAYLNAQYQSNTIRTTKGNNVKLIGTRNSGTEGNLIWCLKWISVLILFVIASQKVIESKAPAAGSTKENQVATALLSKSKITIMYVSQINHDKLWLFTKIGTLNKFEEAGKDCILRQKFYSFDDFSFHLYCLTKQQLLGCLFCAFTSNKSSNSKSADFEERVLQATKRAAVPYFSSDSRTKYHSIEGKFILGVIFIYSRGIGDVGRMIPIMSI